MPQLSNFVILAFVVVRRAVWDRDVAILLYTRRLILLGLRLLLFGLRIHCRYIIGWSALDPRSPVILMPFSGLAVFRPLVTVTVLYHKLFKLRL
jgi:hypothetical protein